ncbi:hypothetical protein BGX23_010500 [Mortierella sp. AD031]|nr:hypothetical protein BGX23_010500 [Mortierella sp. AD031]
MPALLCSTPQAEPTAPTTDLSFKKQQQQQQQQRQSLNLFDLPEICDQIAGHLDRQTLTVVVRVSSQWCAHFIRHLWRQVRVESGAKKCRNMLQAFPHLSKHIRHLEWVHLTSSASSSSSSDSIIPLDDIELSSLNAETILFSSWTNELDAATLARFTQSSVHRLSALQLFNMAHIRGDLLEVVATLPTLRHFTLSMAHRDPHNNHHRQQSGASTSSSVGSPLAASPTGNSPTAVSDKVTAEAELVQFTSADSLPALMDACPQLRMIEILDLPTPATQVVPTSVAVSQDEDQDQDQEDENQDQDQEMEGKDTLSLEKAATNWVPMQHLSTINLHATAISGSTLSALFARCPQLVKLNLGQNTPLYLSGFHLDSSLCMSALSTLMLSGCHFLDGHGYKEIFKALPKIHTLDIPQTNVDDAALAVLGHQCLQLTDLDLDGCHQITDQGIRDMLSHPRSSNDTNGFNNTSAAPSTLERYENQQLHFLSVSNCTELTGQGIHHILMTCGRLRSLGFQQPEIMPESLFPHTLETDDDDPQENPSTPIPTESMEPTVNTPATTTATVYPTFDAVDTTTTTTNTIPTTTTATTTTTDIDTELSSSSDSHGAWACNATLEHLRINNLNVLNPYQTRFLNERLRELAQLKVLHIGGSQLELSILNGLGHLENLYIDDLAREVDLEDVRWLVDHTPNLTRLWCRQLIRHSEPWKLLRDARKHLKLW